MRKSCIICAILLLLVLSFLPIKAVSPDEQYMDATVPQYDFYKRAEDEKIAKIVEARYHTSWASGIDIDSACKVDLNTREVFDIEWVDIEGFDLEILESEWVEIDGYQFAVFTKSELEENGYNSYWREY